MQAIILTVIFLYLTLMGGMYMAQRALMYHPDQTIPSLDDYNVKGLTDIRISGYEDVNLHAWWKEPLNGKPTLVYFQGNAGHIGERAYKIDNFISNGYGILLMSYRYNANAQGEPSEKALIADGKAAIEWLKHKNVQADTIILYGESLGSGVAVALAAINSVKALILEAPYSSVAEVAQSAYWYLPAYWLVKDKFDSVARITKVDAPILIVHGAQDKTIPMEFGQKLHAAAGDQAEFILLEQAGHTNLYDHGMGAIVTNFLRRHS